MRRRSLLQRGATTAAREELVRALGLDDTQAAKLTLPERLPDLPKAPKAKEVAATATEQRLDVQLARAQLDVAGKSQGINLLSTFIDVEVGGRRDTVFDNAEGTRARGAASSSTSGCHCSTGDPRNAMR